MRSLSFGPSILTLTLLLAAFLPFAACGDDDDAPEGRPITAGDLPQIILQQDDVQIGRQLEPITQGDENSSAYNLRFEVPPADALPGETACATVTLALYPDPSRAAAAFASVEDSLDNLGSDAQTVNQREFVPVLGDESDGYRTTSTALTFCASYVAQPADALTIYFRDHDLLGNIAIYNLESGATIEQIVRLAERQLDRIEAFRAAEPS